MVRKVIRSAGNHQCAEKMIERVKKYPGVTYAKMYMVCNSTYHVLVSGDFSDEVEKKILNGRENLAGK